MPYKIYQVQSYPPLYKVKKNQRGRPKYFSKKRLTYEQAMKQLKAIVISEHRRK